MKQEKNNLIFDLSFQFAVDIIAYTEILEEKRKYNLANQLFKAGTSIGANANEAQNAESKVDFIHKMKVAAKEAEETRYWLRLCKASKNYPDTDSLINQVQSILNVLNKIIGTSKGGIS
jgi:four helix bundle protein